MPGDKAFCTLAFGSHSELLDIGRPAIEEYCERHGYELVVRSAQVTDLPPPWEKIPLVRELLDDYREVLWMDADAVIVDTSTDIFDELPADRSLGLVMHVVNNSLLLNTGVLAWREGPQSRALLDEVWELRERYRDHSWWEQAALASALGFRTIGGLLRLVSPGRDLPSVEFLTADWNSIAFEYTPTARIKHYPSVPHELRLKWMRRDLQLAAGQGQPVALDLTVVFLLHGADHAQLERFVASVHDLVHTPGTQIVIATTNDRAFDGLDSLRPAVTVLRSDVPSDEALLDALVEVDGRVAVLAGGAVPLNQELLGALVQFSDANPEAALLRATGAGELLVFQRARLPAANWFTFPHQPAPPFSELKRALTATGTTIVG